MNAATTLRHRCPDLPPASARILFLAARPGVAASLRQCLDGDGGLELELVLDPDEVLASAAVSPPNLVLIDLPWAGRTGERLAARLRAGGRPPRLAVIGDHSGARGREAARRLGAVGFTPDPSSRDLLKVLRHLACPRPRRMSCLQAA